MKTKTFVSIAKAVTSWRRIDVSAEAGSEVVRAFRKKMMEDTFAWFHRSQDLYRKYLEQDNEQRWNIRFNYELVRTALEQAKQDQDDKPVKVLRPRDQIEQADTKIAG